MDSAGAEVFDFKASLLVLPILGKLCACVLLLARGLRVGLRYNLARFLLPRHLLSL